MNDEKKCATCAYFCPIDVQHLYDAGKCRRRSPGIAGFPLLKKTEWCGEHKEKQIEKKGHK